jgi:hypothetical protein
MGEVSHGERTLSRPFGEKLADSGELAYIERVTG